MLRYIRSIPSTASLTWWLRISATLCAIIAKAPVVRYCLSKAFRPFIGPTELGSTNARHEPAIGATFLARLVGLRRSLVSFLFEHDLFGKPVPTFPDHALALEFGLEAGCDRRRHERRDVAAHGCDLAHQCGGDRADRRRGRNEHGMHVRRHGFVHAGDLHLEIEVGTVAQATDHDGRAMLLRGGNREVVVGRAVEGAAGGGGYRGKYLLDHLQPLVDRKHRLFTGIDPDGDNQPVTQADSVPDHIEVAISDGIEGAGIKRDTGHRPPLPRPERPGKPDWFPAPRLIPGFLYFTGV